MSAFAVLPVADALMAFVAFPAVWYLGGRDGYRPIDPVRAARAFALPAGVSGLLVTLCGAVPVVFTLMKRGPVSFAQALLGGFALGNAPFAVYLAFLLPFAVSHLAMGSMSDHLSPLSELLAGVLRAVTIGSAMGMASAVIFWFLGIRGTDVSGRRVLPQGGAR